MRRRDLLGRAVATAALAPFGAAAQPGMPVIGFLSSLSPESEAFIVRERAAFLESLEKAGFVAGRNVAIEYRFAGGQNDRLPGLAAELVRLPVAVLVTLGAQGAVAAKKATATIPIVFGSGVDPVRLGLVASLNRPAGNATGVSSFAIHLGPKRLEMLRELLPQPRLIAVLTNPIALETPEIEAAAQALGQPLLVLQARDASEIDAAFATMAEHQAGGLICGGTLYFQVIADKLVGLAARYRIPTVYVWPEFVAAGGLMSYSVNRAEIGRIIGDYVGRILKGAAPADLPVVQSSRFELVINLKTAKDLGLTVPQTLLARADEIIE